MESPGKPRGNTVLKTTALAATAVLVVIASNAATTVPVSKAMPSGGWEALGEARIDGAADLLGYGETNAAIKGIAGRIGLPISDIVPEAGETRRVGDFTVISGCSTGDCEHGSSMIVADASSRTVYAAWKPNAGRALVVPELKEWPEGAKQEAIAWIKKAM